MIKNRKDDKAKVRFSPSQLIEFEKKLLKAKQKILKQRNFTSGIFLNPQGDTTTEQSAYRTHVADIGTDTCQKEISSQLSSYESEILMQIDEALQRIRNNRYGDCIKCAKPIAKARLRVIPYAQICVKCTTEKIVSKKNR